MLVGCDPPAVLREEDRAMIEWFDRWLAWQEMPYEQRVCVPEPRAPRNVGEANR